MKIEQPTKAMKMKDVRLTKKIQSKPLKFNASLGFPHRPPYDSVFAERIPVLQAFQYALANYIYERRKVKNTLRGRLRLLFQPSRHPFRSVECGVYTGSSLVACASLARDMGISYKMIGLDTFTGLPPLSEKDKGFAPEGAPYLKRQFFNDTSINIVQEKIDIAGLSKGVQLIQGLFTKTLPLLQAKKYHFVNIDCDLYEPHIECLEYFYPRMASGGVIFFDDYHSGDYPMARKAIDVFMQDKCEELLHLRFGPDAVNRTKSFVIKY